MLTTYKVPSFEEWVEKELNPYRISNGLLPLDDDDIKKCKQIIDSFDKMGVNKC